MKIGLDMGGNDAAADKAAENRHLENMILNAKKGDWEAKNAVAQKFQALLMSRAEKRSDDTARINTYLEAGKIGLNKACSKYKPAVGPSQFQIFALDFIEAAMDRVDKGGGFFAKLFGK